MPLALTALKWSHATGGRHPGPEEPGTEDPHSRRRGTRPQVGGATTVRKARSKFAEFVHCSTR